MKEVAAFEEGGYKKRRVTLILPNIVTVISSTPPNPWRDAGKDDCPQGGDILESLDIGAYVWNNPVKNTKDKPISIAISDDSDIDDEATNDENMADTMSHGIEDDDMADDVLAMHEAKSRLSVVSMKIDSNHIFTFYHFLCIGLFNSDLEVLPLVYFCPYSRLPLCYFNIMRLCYKNALSNS